jgi:DNA-binding IclR family transcriptional regulator
MDDLPADPEHVPVNVAVRAAGRAARRQPASSGVVGVPPTRTVRAALTMAFRAEAAELRDQHAETVCLSILDGPEAVVIAMLPTTRPEPVTDLVGSRVPAFAAAGGRVLLAALPPKSVDAMFAGAALATPSGRRLDGLGELHRVLGRARANGYADDVNETSPAHTCLAAPVSAAGGRVVAAIALCIPAERMGAPRRAQLLDDLRIAAGRASAAVRAVRPR